MTKKKVKTKIKTKKNKRYARKNPLDQFYTKSKVAAKLIKLFDLSKYTCIIEPSAGSGSFSKLIPNCIALDVDPKDDAIIKQDFLTYENTNDPSTTLVIGNPPFGKQNNLAIQFINHAAAIADTIAFILPLSFKKTSVQNRIMLSHHLIKCKKLPKNSFIFEEKDYDVPSVFQIWEKRTHDRILKLPEKPIHFKYTSADKADLSIRRVGFYAGHACTDLKKKPASHLFITLTDKTKIDKVTEFLTNYKWKYNDTVGPRTVSRYDLNRMLNRFLS